MIKLAKFFTRLMIGLVVSCSGKSAFAQTHFWQQTNGPYGGNIKSLAINARGHIFAGTDDGGVFRSTNNGDNWTAVNTGLPNTNVLSLAINASGHIFAGTDDGVFAPRITAIVGRQSMRV